MAIKIDRNGQIKCLGLNTPSRFLSICRVKMRASLNIFDLNGPTPLNISDFFVCFLFRAMLDQVYFPSVTLCNINQGRRSFFLEQGLHTDRRLLRAVLAQVLLNIQRNNGDIDIFEALCTVQCSFFGCSQVSSSRIYCSTCMNRMWRSGLIVYSQKHLHTTINNNVANLNNLVSDKRKHGIEVSRKSLTRNSHLRPIELQPLTPFTSKQQPYTDTHN